MLNEYHVTEYASKDKIARDVADQEQRHLIVEAQIRNGIPLQIRAMREDRGWTQTALAEKLGTTQNTVSRLENPKTSKPAITTLERIAEAFDVALLVRFAPFSEFVDSVASMSRKSVAVPSYEKENGLSETEEEPAVTETIGSLAGLRNLAQAESGDILIGQAFHGFGLFSDEVFSSIDLNRRSAEVLNHARKNPVTIARNNERFALIRREQAASLVKGLTQMMEVMQLAQGVVALRKNDPDSVPPGVAWIRAFDEEDRLSMLTEVFAACAQASTDDGWEEVEALVHEWYESAIVVETGVLREAMESDPDEQPLTDPSTLVAQEVGEVSAGPEK